MAKMRETIKTVAIDHFFRKGYFATSVSDIAQGCGIQKASIYHHFAAKEDILFCIMQATMTDLMTELTQSLTEQVDVDCQMRAAVRSHVSFHLSRQKETFIASSELRGLSQERYAQIVALRDDYEKVFQDLISKGIRKGRFAVNDVKILSYAILTLCTAGATWYKPSGRLEAVKIVDIYEDFIINGLVAGGSSNPRPPELACDPWPV